MKCPKCANKLYVYDSFSVDEKETYREYACKACQEMFCSYEKLDVSPMLINNQKIVKFFNRLNRAEEKKLNSIK